MSYTPSQLRDFADHAGELSTPVITALLRAHADALERLRVAEGALARIFGNGWREAIGAGGGGGQPLTDFNLYTSPTGNPDTDASIRKDEHGH